MLTVKLPQPFFRLQLLDYSSKMWHTVEISVELHTWSIFRIYCSKVYFHLRLQSRFRIGHHFIYLIPRHWI